jgi:hypothetical protein
MSNGALDVEEVVSQYVAAATAHGRATESGDYKTANASVPKVIAAHARLRQLGKNGEDALRALLNHSEPGVRLWVAWHALEFEPQQAERVLAELALLKGSLVGFSAQMALRRRDRVKLLYANLRALSFPTIGKGVGDFVLYDSLLAGCADRVVRGEFDVSNLPALDSETASVVTMLRKKSDRSDDENAFIQYFDLLQSLRLALGGTMGDVRITDSTA